MPFLQRALFMATNAIFDTGCIGLQSCIEMQPKKCMQPTDKSELVALYQNINACFVYGSFSIDRFYQKHPNSVGHTMPKKQRKDR